MEGEIDVSNTRQQTKGWSGFVGLHDKAGMKSIQVEQGNGEAMSTQKSKGWSCFINFNTQERDAAAEAFEGNKAVTDIMQSESWSNFSEAMDVEKSEENTERTNVVVIEDDKEEFRPKLSGLDEIKDDSEENADALQPITNNSPQVEGYLIVWGCGEFGQHGHGHHSDVPIHSCIINPLLVGQDGLVIHTACGSSHTVVVTADNRLFSWGNSNSGQLGIGITDTTLQPHLVPLGVTPGTRIQGVACGTRHTFVWTEEGECFSFGNNYSAQLGYDFRKPDFKENQAKPIYVDTLFNRKVTQVACGSRHSLFLFSNGHLASVGSNNRGQIGLGDKIDTYCIKNVPDMQGITSVSCGNSHCLAADCHGDVYAWGYGKACGSREDLLSPECVFTSRACLMKALAGGDSHSMMLLTNGQLFTWGNNYEGQLGQGSGVKFLSSPNEIKHPSLEGKVEAISVGENTSAAVTDEGQLYMWGQNSSQIVCEDKDIRHFQYVPCLVDLGDWKVHKVSCGSWHVTCIVSGSYIKPSTEHRVTPAPPELKPEKPPVLPDDRVNIVSYVDAPILNNVKSTTGEIINETDAMEVTDNIPSSSDNDVSNRKDDVMSSTFNVKNYADDVTQCTDDANDVFMDYPLEETVVDCYGNLVEQKPRTSSRSLIESALETMPPSDSPTEEKPERDQTSNICGTKAAKPAQIYSGTEMDTRVIRVRVVENQAYSPIIEDGVHPPQPDNTEPKISHLTELSTTGCEDMDTIVDIVSSETSEVREEKPPIARVEQTKPEGTKSKASSITIVTRSSKPNNPKAVNKPVRNVTIGFTDKDKRVERSVARENTQSKKSISSERSTSSNQFRSSKSGVITPAGQGSSFPTSSVGKKSARSPQLEYSTKQTTASPTPTQFGSVASCSPPARPRTRAHPPSMPGHLNREKKPVRSLRKMPTETKLAYYLANQPMDIASDTTWTRPHPPRRGVTRTHSHPNMYPTTPSTPPSPASKIRTFSTSSPPASKTNVRPLEPRPPRTQKPGTHKPVFSSGSSWRRRDSDLL